MGASRQCVHRTLFQWVVAMFVMSINVIEPADSIIVAHNITHLPVQGSPMRSQQFSGYIDIGNGNFVHYWFVTSESSTAATDPLIFWTNGGPGCSSLEGLMTEHGPFQMDPVSGSITRNAQTWARIANMLYVEQPVGVGFSYATNPTDLNDTSSANLNVQFLINWFSSFSEYKKNDFYISGESYAGIYVPMLAHATLKHNTAVGSADSSYINLKGVLVGNGCTGKDTISCGNIQLDFATSGAGQETNVAYSRGLISTAIYNNVTAACTGPVSWLDCYAANSTGTTDICWQVNESVWMCPIPSSDPLDHCCKTLDAMDAGMGSIDIYNIYAPCMKNPADSSSAGPMDAAQEVSHEQASPALHLVRRKQRMMRRLVARRSIGTTTGDVSREERRLSRLHQRESHGLSGCMGSDAKITAWLNQPEVRSALHVLPASATPGPGAWGVCNDWPKFNYTKTVRTVIPYYHDFVNQGVKVLIYSGDIDACVPFTGTAAWVENFTSHSGWAVAESSGVGWSPWHVAHQVAGYLTAYNTGAAPFMLTTIRGAGHMVPTDKPKQALAMLWNFISACPRWGKCGATTITPTGFLYSNTTFHALENATTIRQASPVAITHVVGTPFVLQVQLNGSYAAKPEYQWYSNGTLLPGATTDTLALPASQVTCNTIVYSVVITTVNGASATCAAQVSMLGSDSSSSSGHSSVAVGFGWLGGIIVGAAMTVLAQVWINKRKTGHTYSVVEDGSVQRSVPGPLSIFAQQTDVELTDMGDNDDNQ
eukprot:m.310515 g.310515  ORF g.310515 m.310515 type:complete len:765 (-) comp20210_c1_seq6:87-2381(-)